MCRCLPRWNQPSSVSGPFGCRRWCSLHSAWLVCSSWNTSPPTTGALVNRGDNDDDDNNRRFVHAMVVVLVVGALKAIDLLQAVVQAPVVQPAVDLLQLLIDLLQAVVDLLQLVFDHGVLRWLPLRPTLLHPYLRFGLVSVCGSLLSWRGHSTLIGVVASRTSTP